MSLKTQKPLPQFAEAWWVPPDRLPETPSLSAARAAATVPKTLARDRATSASLQENPSLRWSAGASVPEKTASRYSGVCASNRDARSINRDSSSSSGASTPSATRRSRTRRYFGIGNRCPGGSGTSYVSQKKARTSGA